MNSKIKKLHHSKAKEKKGLCDCCNEILKRKKINFPNFSHFKFKLLKKNFYVHYCKKCNLIRNNNLTRKDLLFFSKKGYTELDTNQKTFIKNKINAKHEDQFKFLKKKKLIFNNAKVLDIGCNKGYLIDKIRKNLQNSFVVGYEKNPFLVKLLKKKKIFFNYQINTKIKFDLIILSHSLMYFKNINFLINNILKNLDKNGKVFIESPNIESSPYYLLMGDQYYFFSPFSLNNIFLKFNLFPNYFQISKDKSNFLIVFSKNKKKKLNFRKLNLDNSIKYLSLVKRYLINIKNKPIKILGTTVKAAFLYYYVNNNVDFFVDEETKIKDFYNLDVKHPSNLKKNDLILVPMKEKINILKKLEKKYLGKFKII